MKKLLLLHGWNYLNYTNMTNSNDAWNNRKKFVQALEKKYKIYKLNFPGFCGEKEPNVDWTLDDYAKYVNDYIKNNDLKIDYILGYSFGGAVAVHYNKIYNNKYKLILISPALVRNANNSKKFIKTPKFLNGLRNRLRNYYVIKIKKVSEMVYGTKFLQNTYQNIVRVNTLNELKYTTDFIIIYGDSDNMVNPFYVINNIDIKYKDKIYVIGGGHDIANTNYEPILFIIDNYLK